MNKKTTLVKEDINRGRFELIKESPSGHGVYVEKSLIERRYLNLAIYRYMQLPHLLNLLSSPHEFYVANRQSFSDLRDKMAIVKKMEEIKNVYSEAESWKNRRYLREKKEKIRKAWQQCISCWCLDIMNSGIADENYLMWKAYTSNQISVRVGSTILHFIESIIEIPYDIFIAKVDYKNKYTGDIYDVIFKKHEYYEDEQELRMLVLSDEEKGVHIPIDINILIDEIRVSPFLSPNMERFIINQLGEQEPSLKKKILPSLIMEYIK